MGKGSQTLNVRTLIILLNNGFNRNDYISSESLDNVVSELVQLKKQMETGQ